MIDPLFTQALIYFFINNSVVMYSVGIVTALVLVICLLTVIKKWGESY